MFTGTTALLTAVAVAVAFARPESDEIRSEAARKRLEAVARAWQALGVYEGVVLDASSDARQMARRPNWLREHTPRGEWDARQAHVATLLDSAEVLQGQFVAVFREGEFYIGPQEGNALKDHWRWIRFVHNAESTDLDRHRQSARLEELTGVPPRMSGEWIIEGTIEDAIARLDQTRRGVSDVEQALLNDFE